jgi:hypothetical protein
MKTQIDAYIKKATTGLPSRERIDTAAELRVHLNAQVKKHLLEGHSREEAEFLAVDAMGAPAPVNRQFLGHIFTPQLGWRLVAGALLAIALFFGVQKLLEPRAGIHRVESTVADVTLAMWQKFHTFEFIAPENARSMRFYEYIPGQKQWFVEPTTIPANRKVRITLRIGSNKECPKGRMAAVGIDQSSIVSAQNRGFSCVLNKKHDTSNYSYSSKDTITDFALNKWYSIFSIQPTPDRDYSGNLSDSESGSDYSQNPKNQYAYFVMFSNQDQSGLVNPPYVPNHPNTQSRFVNSQDKFFQDTANIPIPKNAVSVQVVGSAGQARYNGYAVDLRNRPNFKRVKINFLKTALERGVDKGCLETNWDVKVTFEPGSRWFDLCQYSENNMMYDFPKDGSLYGEFVSRLLTYRDYRLDTWIPIYVVPNYATQQLETPEPSRDPKNWYIIQIKFSNKPIPEGKLSFPKDLPTYKLNDPNDYYSLEAVK